MRQYNIYMELIHFIGDSNDGAIGVQSKAYLESRIKQLEKGIPGNMISKNKGAGQGKKIEKYNSDNTKSSGLYNDEDEVKITEFTKKKKQRSKSEDQEEQVPAKKKKKIVEVDDE